MNGAVLSAASLFVFVGFVLATAALIVWNTFDNVIYLYYSAIGFLSLAGLTVLAALIIPSGKDKKEALVKAAVVTNVVENKHPQMTPSSVPVQKVIVTPPPQPQPAVISPAYAQQPVPAPIYYPQPPQSVPMPYYPPYPPYNNYPLPIPRY